MLGVVAAGAVPAMAQAQSMTVVGSSNLGGAGRNGEVAVVGNTAIVGSGLLAGGGVNSGFYNPISCPAGSVKVVDLSTPSAPRVAATIPVQQGVAAVDIAALRVDTPSFKGDLAAVALAACNFAPGQLFSRGVVYYDVSNPTSPQELGRYMADDDGTIPVPNVDIVAQASSQRSVDLVQRADGKVLSLSTEPGASASNFDSGDLRVVDVTNPRAPTEVGSFPNGTERPPTYDTRPAIFSPNGCRPFAAGRGAAAAPGGRTALLPYFDQGLLNVDISNPANPGQLAQFGRFETRRPEGNAAYVSPASVGGRTLALLSGEDWVGPESSLRIDSPAAVAGSPVACEAMFTLFDPEDTAQVYRQPGSQLPGDIVYVGRGCPGDTFLADPRGKIALRDRSAVGSRQSGPLQLSPNSCGFADAVKEAQDRGAKGVVVAQTAASAPEAFSADGVPTSKNAGLDIPMTMIDKSAADPLRDALCPAPTPAGSGCGAGAQTGKGAMVDGPSEWGDLRVVDVSNPAAPTLRGAYRTPRSRLSPPPDLGVYSIHHAVATGSTAYVAANSDGLRVLDLTSATPNEVASFVPRDTPDPTGAIPAKAYVTGVAAAPGGRVVITDVNSGLYLLSRPGPGGGGSGTAPGTGGPQLGRPPAGTESDAERSRARALRRCLTSAERHARRESRHIRRERRLARRGSARRRARARRHLRRHRAHLRRHRAALRRRCLRRHGRTPGRVTGLRARSVSSTRIRLSFRAPGTNGRRGPAARKYLVKQSTRPIRSRRSFRRAKTLCRGRCKFDVTRVGVRVTLTITGLRPNATYYYSVAARDNVSGRLGRRSRTAKARTR